VSAPARPAGDPVPLVARPPSVAARPRPARGEPSMRAAVVRTYGQPLSYDVVAIPEPPPGEALLRVRAVGICATDLKVASGSLDGMSSVPVIPGHEVAGDVVAARGHPELEGRRAAVYLYDTCGACLWCASGRATLCRSAVRPGIERDGGMAGFVAVPVACLLTFGSGLSYAHAAVTMDAVTTPWGALHGRAGLRAGERVAVVGSGGLGLNGIQIALGAGAEVAVIDPAPGARELAVKLGAGLAVGPDELDAVRAWAGAGGGVDLALETSGVRAGFDAAVAVLRPGGRVVCNGYQPGLEYGLDSRRLVLDEIDVLGSRVASREDARAALDAVERGDVRPHVSRTLPLARVNEALGLLRGGEVEGRLVLEPEDTAPVDGSTQPA
jgi:D-arabinose 1-dehydrogenase-like Zn-dependent alcohol dehydrogenase